MSLSKDRFEKLLKLMNKGPKATAEEEASKDPEKFMKKMKNPSIKGLKGIAF